MDYTLPTSEETNAILASPQDEVLEQFTAEEKEIANKLIPLLTPKILEEATVKANAKMAKELDDQVRGLVEANKKLMQEELDRMRKANEPLQPAELEKLINQEYFEAKIDLGAGRGTYTISELSVKHEKRLLKVLKGTIVAAVQQASSLEWSTEMSNLERLQMFVDSVPGALDAASECVAIILNPKGENTIDLEWVLNNLPTVKILSVILLQLEANKYRDFFLLASRTIPSQMMA